MHAVPGHLIRIRRWLKLAINAKLPAKHWKRESTPEHRARRDALDNTFQSVAGHYLAHREKQVRLPKRSRKTLKKARWHQ
ncbi:MAG: hypothetical protein JWN85_3042 [Gammaproteobacteria bacterium]|nr:hypothetical protein [Gammaproteobacteria bacterium]